MARNGISLSPFGVFCSVSVSEPAGSFCSPDLGGDLAEGGGGVVGGVVAGGTGVVGGGVAGGGGEVGGGVAGGGVEIGD